MPTLYWDQDSNQICPSPTTLNPASYQSARGFTGIRLIIKRSDGSQLLLDPGVTVGIALRDGGNVGAGYAAGPVDFTRGASAADGYLGSVSTDSTFVRQGMSVGVPGATESPSYVLSAVFYYYSTTGGAPVESAPFTWNVTPPYYRTTEPPADILADWDSAAQLHAAIVQAAAAIKNGDNATLLSLGVGTLSFGEIDYPFDSVIKGQPQGESDDPAPVPWSVLVTGAGSCAGFLSVPAGQSVRRKADGTAFEAFTPNTGDGSGLTNLNASSLATGTIPTAVLPAAVIGSSHYKGVWNAATNVPALVSGAGEAGGYYLVNTPGGTTLDGVSAWRVGDQVIFDGARWDKIDGSVNPVADVDGVTGDANGHVALPSDQAPSVASKRTLGAGTTQAAPGNDARFAAAVTGLRKASGAGSLDVAAVPGVDYLTPGGSGAALTNVAPFHPSAAGYGGPTYGGGGTNNPTADISVQGGPGNTTVFQRATGLVQVDVCTLGDASGEIGFYLPSSPVAAGTTLGTIKFLNPYTGTLPATVFFLQNGLVFDPSGSSSESTPYGAPDPTKGQLSATMTSAGLTIKTLTALASGVLRIKYQYFIPVV